MGFKIGFSFFVLCFRHFFFSSFTVFFFLLFLFVSFFPFVSFLSKPRNTKKEKKKKPQPQHTTHTFKKKKKKCATTRTKATFCFSWFCFPSRSVFSSHPQSLSTTSRSGQCNSSTTPIMISEAPCRHSHTNKAGNVMC